MRSNEVYARKKYRCNTYEFELNWLTLTEILELGTIVPDTLIESKYSDGRIQQ